MTRHDSMAESNTRIKDEAFPPPHAVSRRNALEIIQDAAVELVNACESFSEEKGTRLLATNPPGTEHGDLPLPIVSKGGGDVVWEFSKGACTRILRTLERANLELVSVARIDNENAWIRNQRVPIFRLDISACCYRRLRLGNPERHNFALDFHF